MIEVFKDLFNSLDLFPILSFTEFNAETKNDCEYYLNETCCATKWHQIACSTTKSIARRKFGWNITSSSDQSSCK